MSESLPFTDGAKTTVFSPKACRDSSLNEENQGESPHYEVTSRRKGRVFTVAYRLNFPFGSLCIHRDVRDGHLLDDDNRATSAKDRPP